MAAQKHLPGGSGFQPGQNSDKGRLAAAGGADNRHKLASMDTKIHPLQRCHRTVYRFKGFAKFADFKDHIASLQFVKAGLDCLTLGEVTRQFHVGHVQLITLTSSFVARPFPGKEHVAQLREYDVRQQPNNANHDDRGEYIVEILIPCLLCNEPGDARTGANELQQQ